MKDPAVLFYYQDFLVGTEFMTDEEVGKYIRILCHQADKGALTESQITRICRGIIPPAIMEKLRRDSEGKFYQERMRIEKEKRVNYSDSRRQNRQKKDENICKTYDSHMENENINEDINEINIEFSVFWNLYEKKVGNKKLCIQRWNKLKDAERQKIIDTLPIFKSRIKDKQFQPYPEKYLNQRRWEDESESIPVTPKPHKENQSYLKPDWKFI